MLFEGNARKQREREMQQAGRLPPGQALTLKWPVLHYGSVPKFDPATWDFRVSGLVEAPLRLDWEQFQALPKIEITSDFHCVTRWSRFDNRWRGVAFRTVLELVKLKPRAGFVLVHAEQGWPIFRCLTSTGITFCLLRTTMENLFLRTTDIHCG